MEELISRQAAIDALLGETRYKSLDEIRERLEETWNRSNEWLGGIGDAIAVIESLPSTQQEIIRCKDCKYNDYEEQNSTTRWLPCIDAAWPDNWFCGCAERRKDG